MPAKTCVPSTDSLSQRIGSVCLGSWVLADFRYVVPCQNLEVSAMGAALVVTDIVGGSVCSCEGQESRSQRGSDNHRRGHFAGSKQSNGYGSDRKVVEM